MEWSFAIINNKLAEVYFEKKRGKTNFFGHCYVKKTEYKTKHEIKMIEKDIARIRFTYRKGEYIKKLPITS